MSVTRASLRSYGLLIDGADREDVEWAYLPTASALIRDVESGSGTVFETLQRLSAGEIDFQDAPDYVLSRCAVGTDRHNAEAVEAAHRAKREWGATPTAVRREFTMAFVSEVDRRREEFVEILIAEGHPRRLAEWEVRGVMSGASDVTLDWVYDQMHSEYRLGERRVIMARKPDGVVCLNPPQNAAGSNAALGVGALAAGNTLVVKAPRSCPTSVMFLYREIVAPLLEQFGAPPGTVNIVCGDTRRILRQWMDSPLVDDIMFFGGSDVGVSIGRDCAKAGKKAVLELSGNDAVVIWRDADLDAAATALAECFYGSSQICMVPKQAVVHHEVADELFARLLACLDDIRPGYPEDPNVLLSPVIKAGGYFDYIGQAQQLGGTVLCGAERMNAEGAEDPRGLFLAPTVVRVDGLIAARGLDCVREETFFPLLPVAVTEPAEDDDDLLTRVIDYVNANQYGLRNSLWTADERVVDRFVSETHNAGQLKVNESHIGFVPLVATHGGTGLTGGPSGELHYPMLRTTHLQAAVITPHGTHTARSLRDEVSFAGTGELDPHPEKVDVGPWAQV